MSELEKGRAPLDVALGRVAARQHGVVTVAQLRELGLTDSSVGNRVRAGRLYRLYKGVYAVGHSQVLWEGRSLAGALSVGSDAVLSHWTAARVWGLLDARPGPVDVTVARRVRSRRGIRVHTVRNLDANDRTTADGVPLTTVTRTLLDLADVAGERTLTRTVRDARAEDRCVGPGGGRVDDAVDDRRVQDPAARASQNTRGKRWRHRPRRDVAVGI